MHFDELTPAEQRVLGCLIEKRWTTPDQYPLSLNGLRLACNQLTNRDPVTAYDEATVRAAADRLSRYGLARLASGQGSRAVKYRHLAEEALSLSRDELAALAVLLLRGPQTPGELKARSERMASFVSLDDVDRVLGVLCERGYARRIPRRPGQKEDRYEQLLGGAGESEIEGPLGAADVGENAQTGHGVPTGDAPADERELAARIAALEARVEQLSRELSALRSQSPALSEPGRTPAPSPALSET